MASEWERVWARKKSWVSAGVFLFFLLFSSVWLRNFKIGFLDAEHEVVLDALNFAPFLLKEVGFLLMFVLVPMLLVDSLSGERASGAYRMVLVRAYSRGEFLLAKWGVLAAVMALYIGVAFVFGVIWGLTMMPGEPEGLGGALWYAGKYYALYYLILLAAMGVCSVIAMLVGNAVMVFVGLVGSYVAMLYAAEELSFFVLGCEALFRALAGDGTFYAALLAVLAAGYGISWGVWKKKDILC